MANQVPTFFIKTGDTPTLNRTFYNQDNQPISIFGATVHIHMFPTNSTVVTVDQAMTNLDINDGLTTGKVTYTFTNTQTATSGFYYVEYRITYGNGTVITIPTPGYELFQIDKF